MNLLAEYHESIAALVARMFLGLLFLFQGYDAVVKIKVKNVIRTYEHSFSEKGIPKFLTVCGAWFTSYTELIGGALLILGLFKYITLLLLGINILLASVAFGIITPMWDTRFVLPRILILIFLLIIPPAWDTLSADHLIAKLLITNK